MHRGKEMSMAMHGHLSDADLVRDCLFSSKEKARIYAEAALESANNGVREFFLAMHGEETHNTEVLFHFLHARDLYTVQEASEERIRQTREHFSQMHDALELEAPSNRRYHTADPENHPASTKTPERFDYKHN